jgi:hypothetical protein
MLIGEKFLTSAALNGSTCNDDQGWVNGWDNDMITFSQGDRTWTAGLTNPPAVGVSVPPQPFNAQTLTSAFGTTNCGGIFGSIHDAGMSSVFCDGSVHTVRFDVAQVVFFSMCSINDAVPVTLDD